MGGGDGVPRVWRYVAGVESVGDLRHTKAPHLMVWTAAPKSRRGDLVVLYGKRPVMGYVAVARQCSDPLPSRHGGHWAWLQIQPLGQVVPQARLERKGSIRRHGGLKTPAGGSFNEIPPGAGQADFFKLLETTDVVRRRLDSWRTGGGRYPKGLTNRSLRGAWREEPEELGHPEDHETWLSQAIAEWMVRTGEGWWCKDDDRIGPRSLERRLLIDDTPRYADIVLIDRTRPKTLLVVEVKKYARAARTANPVPQVLAYRDQLRRDHPGWRVRPSIVAPEFDQATLDAARAARIACRRCDRRGKRLRSA